MHNREAIEEWMNKVDLNGPEPIEEPMRQYYFIKKCQEILNKQKEEMGRALTASAVTFGCQMNAVTKIMKIA